MEAVKPSAGAGDNQIRVELDPDGNGPAGFVGVDDIRVTAVSVSNVEWVALNSPVDANNQQNGGLRIFPDKTAPTDTIARDLIDVQATLTPALPGLTVYFRAYDPDDPYLDSTGEIDTNDANGPAGFDNLGKNPTTGAEQKRGTFPSAGVNYGITTITDFAGKATVTFQVTRQPGDNFRIGASLSSIRLDKLDSHVAATKVTPDATQVPASGVMLSEMLTVWRRLWIERDMMASASANSVAVQLQQVTEDVVIGTGHYDVIELDRSLPDGADVFEGGTVTIPSLNKTIPVLANTDEFSDDTITVPANALSDADLLLMSQQEITTATITDDDDVVSLPRLPDGGALLQSAFGNAYIQPLYVDPIHPDWDSPTDTVPFQPYLDDSLASVKGSRQLSSDQLFWTTLVVGCFANKQSTDGDPDGEPLPGGPLVGFDATFDWGLSDADTSAIYLETIRDVGRASGMPEAAVVAHEIGHTPGFGMGHRSTGLMREKEFGSSTEFDNQSLREFRTTLTW